MKQTAKILVVVLFTFITFTFLYSRILQAQINKSGRLFDERCNKVNPAMISYKNSYLQFWEMIKNPKNHTKEETRGKMAEYIEGIKKYIPLEDGWLSKQTSFVESWDFQAFQPKYVKDLAILQLKMYTSQRDSTRIIPDLWEGKPYDSTLAKKAQEDTDNYFEAYENAKEMKDWRKRLWQSPPLNCPEENLIIPDTDINSILPSASPSI